MLLVCFCSVELLGYFESQHCELSKFSTLLQLKERLLELCLIFFKSRSQFVVCQLVPNARHLLVETLKQLSLFLLLRFKLLNVVNQISVLFELGLDLLLGFEKLLT